MSDFVHLRVHTEYSLIDGIVRVKPLMGAIAAGGMPAVALTDEGNLFAMVKFYRAALAAGVKPIIGVDAWVRNDADESKPYRVTFLCMNDKGYRNLTALISLGYTDGQRLGRPYLSYDWIADHAEGLIALSGARQGDVGQALLADKPELVDQALAFWLEHFPNRYYLELQRTGRAHEEDYLHAAVGLAAQRGLPVVATNDVRFIKPDDFEVHEARVCITQGYVLNDSKRPRDYSEQQYCRSAEEMAELFSDMPEALANTVEIAKRCNVTLTLGENFLPQFPIPDGMTDAEFLAEESRKGLEERLPRLFPNGFSDEDRKPYDERLEIELSVINQMGFPGYFLIVADFIRWAKNNQIPVGPGRGSGAGSLVAYALKITDLDPLAYDLLFERFLNPERVSMPDFDIDFCMENRDKVIDYVADYYGREKVSQIITYGTMAAKAVVRDVGRVMGHGYGFVDRIAKMIPFEVGMTLEKAMTDAAELKEAYDNDEEVHTLLDMAMKLEGTARNAGKHAGGVVIAPTKLTDFSPLYCEEGGKGLVTQFDKDDVEAIGLVKFDFLGLRTLTIIDWAVQRINEIRKEQGEDELDLMAQPLDDAAAYQLMKDKQTTAVFQLESTGMKELMGKLQPDNFEDVVALVALFRPGPLGSGMADDFVNRKHGRAKIEYPHPDLEPILQPTYGTILYQEQVMQIAQVLAGYSLGGADLLRRAMGKKKKEVMDEQRDIFVKGSTERGVNQKQAEYIFDLMAEFANYGFNKSHSAAYALLSYQTAWLKVHYPAPFMAAVLSSDMDNTDKMIGLIDECKRMGLEILPPDLNESDYRFKALDEKQIRYGLGAIKGAGEAAINAMLSGREEHGPYKNMDDLSCRVDSGKVNKRVLEALVCAGCFDSIEANRARLLNWAPEALRLADQHHRSAAQGIDDLFGDLLGSDEHNDAKVEMPKIPVWSDKERLLHERDSLGLFLTGHPFDDYVKATDGLVDGRIAALTEQLLDEHRQFEATRTGGDNSRYSRPKVRMVQVAGFITKSNSRQWSNGGRAQAVELNDGTGTFEVMVPMELFEQTSHLLAKDEVVIVHGKARYEAYSQRGALTADQLMSVAQAQAQFATRLSMRLGSGRVVNGFMDELHEALMPCRNGSCEVVVVYQSGDVQADYRLSKEWNITPDERLMHRLAELIGQKNLKMRYDRRLS